MPGLPTAEEWQALGSMLAVAVSVIATVLTVAGLIFAGMAVIYAKRQLEQVAQSNEALSASNLELARPRVVVELALKRMEMLDPKASFFSGLDVVVSNGGRGPAANLLMRFDPLPDAYPLPPILIRLFSGKLPITSLLPGQSLRYEIERFPQGSKFEPEDLEHHRYSVDVSYTDNASRHTFHEHFALHLTHLVFAKFASEPLQRIAKDIQSLNDTVAKNG